MGTQMGVFCITFTGKSIITVTKWVNVNISATKSSDIHLPFPPQIVPCMSGKPQMPGGSFSFFVQHMPWLKQVGTYVQIDHSHLCHAGGSTSGNSFWVPDIQSVAVTLSSSGN